MFSGPPALRSVVIYAVILPIAIVMGYLLATPLDLTSFSMISLMLLVLAIPLLMRWHQPLLFLSWNMSAALFFLPGAPPLWLAMSCISLVLFVVQRTMSKETHFLPSLSVALPLLALAAVVLFTARETGGMGLRVLGSGSIGGKRYILILAGIMGFFAMAAQRIPQGKANVFAGLFLLGSLSYAIGNLFPYVGPEFYVLFSLFPIQDLSIVAGATSDVVSATAEISRYSGITAACMACCLYLLAYYGIRELLNLKKIWRLGLFLFFSAASLYGGFRTYFIILFLTCVLVFYFEGLFRTRIFWGLAICAIGVAAVLVPIANKLPLGVQRSLSVLPFLNLDPVARFDARGSTDWRLAMWRVVWGEVPQYLIIGKGLQINPVQLELAQELAQHGQADYAEVSMLAGDYHNGPLSVLVPFGIPGAAAFLWFLIAAGRAVFLNYRYGDPQHHRLNTFLVGFFIARALLFLFVFGGFYTDIAQFSGIVGFSISLNGGIRGRAVAPVPESVPEESNDPGLRVPMPLRG